MSRPVWTPHENDVAMARHEADVEMARQSFRLQAKTLSDYDLCVRMRSKAAKAVTLRLKGGNPVISELAHDTFLTEVKRRGLDPEQTINQKRSVRYGHND